MSGRSILLAVPLALAVVVLAGCVPESPAPDPTSSGARFAAPDGAGSACTATEPCALGEAIAGSEGGEVRLAGGEYGDVELGSAATAIARTERVVISPADGATAVLGKLTLDLPATTWRGVTISGGVYLDTGASATELEAVHVDGSGVFVHADDVRILESTIENGQSIDGIQIAGATDLLVAGTTVRGFLQEGGSDVHSDCVQIFDSSRIVLRGNYFGDCDNAGLIFSPGNGDGIHDVLVEANHIQGCVTEGAGCSGGTALDLRDVTAITGVVVRNNTILDGAVRVDPIDGLVFDRNIVGYASNCAMPMTNSIVASWNTGNCDRPDALGRDGNRAGEVPVRDRMGGDLAPVDPQDATIDPAGSSEPAGTGFDGEPLPVDQAGAGG